MEKNKFVANTNVTKPNFTVQVEAKDLFLLGWDFENSIQNLVSSDSISYIDARLRVLSRSVRFHFETNQSNQNVFFWYFCIYGEEHRYTTGVNQPIEDLLTLVNNGLYSLDSIVDYSEDVDGNLVGFLTSQIV